MRIYKLIFDKSVLRYLVVGFSAFLADYIPLLVLFHVFHFNLALATSVGFVSGLAVSFIFNKIWVFKQADGGRKTHRQLIEYLALLLVNYAFTVLGIGWLHTLGIDPEISKVLLMAFIMCWNYLLFKYVIFTSNSKSTQV